MGKAYCCKNCRRKKDKEKRDARIASEGTAVYYLPEEHYIGLTNDIMQRMRDHKRYGRITEGYEILCYFERRVDAHLLETMFHVRDYNGFRDETK